MGGAVRAGPPLRRGGAEDDARGDDGGAEEQRRCRRAPQLARDGARGGQAGAVPAVRLRDDEARELELVEDTVVDGLQVEVRIVVDAGHLVRGCAVGQQRAHAAAQILVDVRLEEVDVAHRGISLKGTSLSVRCSPGSPSTRSAMTLRSTSVVPPSIELPFARR